ncbi:hypothetical protein CO046_00250 [Candidatus Peregrinibacteria bacterium CG_4_9_14_0_2_um_filter_53_11]|nr:MAG: hypothetical protein CO046_00250 [Candidatus Peregrinibacteria bacterium CG_4_9_14_0_2_um_filter_53_11]
MSSPSEQQRDHESQKPPRSGPGTRPGMSIATKALIAGAWAAALGVMGWKNDLISCGRRPNSSAPSRAANPADAGELPGDASAEVSNTDAILALPENPDIPMPYFAITGEPVHFEPPKNLQGFTGEELERFSITLGEMLEARFHTDVEPQLNQGIPPSQLIGPAVSATALLLEQSDPRVAAELASFRSTWNQQSPDAGYELVAHLNEYLLPGGHMLYIGVGDRLDLLRVSSTEFRNLYDNNDGPGGEEPRIRVPVLHVASTMKLASESDQGVGEYEHHSGVVLIYPAHIAADAQQRLANRPDYPRFKGPMPLEEMIDHSTEETINGLLVSPYFAARFPKVGREFTEGVGYEATIPVRTKEGERSLTLAFPPAALHLLAQLGMSLATTTSDMPFTHSAYLQKTPADDPVRYLIRQLLPLATIQAAPNTERANAQRALFLHAPSLEQLRALVGTPHYSSDHTNRAGEVLYRIGFDLMHRAEAGELPRGELRAVPGPNPRPLPR